MNRCTETKLSQTRRIIHTGKYFWSKKIVIPLSSQKSGFGIRDPEKNYSGSRGQKGTGSRIRNTGFIHKLLNTHGYKSLLSSRDLKHIITVVFCVLKKRFIGFKVKKSEVTYLSFNEGGLDHLVNERSSVLIFIVENLHSRNFHLSSGVPYLKVRTVMYC